MDANEIRYEATYWTFDISTYAVRHGVPIGKHGEKFYLAGPGGADGPEVLDREPRSIYPDRAAAEAGMRQHAGWMAEYYRKELNKARAALDLEAIPAIGELLDPRADGQVLGNLPEDPPEDDEPDPWPEDAGVPTGRLDPAGASSDGPAYHGSRADQEKWPL